jgi:hypothetical protein
MDDHRLYQRVKNIKQIMQKLDKSFARIESCFAEYKYEVKRERQQIASYSLEPPHRGVQMVITGGYWLKPLTANCLGYCILLTTTANRLSRDDYFYNCRLAVSVL